jgi:hypothetical protein
MSLLLPEWDEMGPGRRLFEAIVVPASGGLGAGWVAASSTRLYVIDVVLAILGAVYIGAQHCTAAQAQRRGLVSGTLFGLMLLLGLYLGGGISPAPDWVVPPSPVLLFLMMAIPAVPLHRLGYTLRRRVRHSGSASTPVGATP